MASITQATSHDFPIVRDLFWEYLQWLNGMLNREFQFNFDVAVALEHNMNDLGEFLPPSGRLLLADSSSGGAGCACVHMIRPRMAELKRMYVRPAQRGKGIGHVLVEALIAELREVGYVTLRLDSAPFMKEAHALYWSMGFREIDPYPESEIPEHFRTHWLFMELPL